MEFPPTGYLVLIGRGNEHLPGEFRESLKKETPAFYVKFARYVIEKKYGVSSRVFLKKPYL